MKYLENRMTAQGKTDIHLKLLKRRFRNIYGLYWADMRFSSYFDIQCEKNHILLFAFVNVDAWYWKNSILKIV